MTVVFVVLPALIGLVALAVAFGSVRRVLQLRAAWKSGLTAEARCLRVYTTRQEDNATTRHHHVYAFTTPDGREVRFEEANGPRVRVAGDIVTVHYTAERPEKATAVAPAPVKSVAALIPSLVCCGLAIAFCTFIAFFAPNPPF